MRLFKTLLVIITILICKSFEVLIYLDFLLDVQGIPTCDPKYPNEKVTLKIIKRSDNETLDSVKTTCDHLIGIGKKFTHQQIVDKVIAARFFYETSGKFYTRRIVEDCIGDPYKNDTTVFCKFGKIP